MGTLPKFGRFRHKRIKMTQATRELNYEFDVTPVWGVKPSNIQSDIVGRSLRNYIRPHKDLSRSDQVVAVIHPDLCINCGKCYMTCNDNAYQAISFDPVTHLATVREEKCTGCGLCQAVCPVKDCIEFVPRHPDRPFKLNRQ